MILLTGATGFVGKTLLLKLTDKNIKVRCLVRDSNKIEKKDNFEIMEGNLLDKKSLCNATKNIEMVVHLAAVIKSSDRQKLMRVNVEGTKNLVEACIKNKVRKIIYFSSLDACLGKTNFYGRTKTLGEKVIKNAHMDYIILRPSLIYGRGCEDIVTLARLVQKLPFVPAAENGKGRLQPVYVEDLCDLVVKIIESNKKGVVYHIAGEEKISLDGLIDKIADVYSKKVLKIHLPLWILFLPLKICSLISRKSSWDYESLKLINTDKICNIAEIKKDFGFAPLNLDKGLIRSLINADVHSHVKHVTKFNDRIDGTGAPSVSMVGRCVFDLIRPYLTKSAHLDVGCWTGGFFSLCRSVSKISIGLDLQLPPLLTGKKHNSHWLFVSGSVLSLSFQNSSFDLVTLSEVIEHLPRNSEVTSLREINRVLRSKGKIFLTTPNMNPISICADPAYFFFGHRHYSVDKLRAMLESADFRIISILHCGGFFQVFNGFLAVAYKYFLKRKFITPFWLNYLIKKEFHHNKKTWWTSTKIVILAEKIK